MGTTTPPLPIRSFHVWPKDRPDWGRSVNATSSGMAKMDLFASLKDAGWGYRYTDLRSRVEGAPVSTDRFQHCAEYRGVPFAKCGMRVRFSDGDEGVIQGHNSSANFNILFTSGKHKGLTLNCHPNWQIAYLGDDGSVIKQF